MNHFLRAAVALAATLCGAALPAQTACYDQGSVPVAASVTPSPLPLGCPSAPNWPMWHLLTPPHRAPAPHAGFTPGDAHALPAVLVTWRCTGLWFAPVVIDDVRRWGYVIDRAERPCVTP
ncbi:MAG: hypothetical protein R3F29_01815 [Planctomycetota bacterium]